MNIYIDPSCTPPKPQTESEGSNSIVLGTRTDIESLTLKRGDQVPVTVILVGVFGATGVKLGTRSAAGELLLLCESEDATDTDVGSTFELVLTVHTETLTSALLADTDSPLASIKGESELTYTDSEGALRVSSSIPTTIYTDVLRDDYPEYSDTETGSLVSTALAAHVNNEDVHVTIAERAGWGDLSELVTEANTSLVAAINEVAASSYGSTSTVVETTVADIKADCSGASSEYYMRLPRDGMLVITDAIDTTFSPYYIVVEDADGATMSVSAYETEVVETRLKFTYAAGGNISWMGMSFEWSGGTAPTLEYGHTYIIRLVMIDYVSSVYHRFAAKVEYDLSPFSL